MVHGTTIRAQNRDEADTVVTHTTVSKASFFFGGWKRQTTSSGRLTSKTGWVYLLGFLRHYHREVLEGQCLRVLWHCRQAGEGGQRSECKVCPTGNERATSEEERSSVLNSGVH